MGLTSPTPRSSFLLYSISWFTHELGSLLSCNGRRFSRAMANAPNHALRRTGPAVTLAAAGLRFSPAAQPAHPLVFLQLPAKGDRRGAILADDLIYTHSSGRVEGKKEFLGSLESGDTKYVAILGEEKKARVYGSVVLVNGRAKVTVNVRGQEQTFVLRYLDVYAKRDGKWQMVAWQSTRLP